MTASPDLTSQKRRLEQLVVMNTENPPGRESEAGGMLRAVPTRSEAMTEVPG
jgi:hypothetical protein